MVDNSLRVDVLGPLQMSVNGCGVRLGAPKQRAVLAMLVINRNRPVATEALIAAVWGEDPPAGAMANIYTYVSNLRKLISDGGLDGKAVLAGAPPGYRLSLPDNACDLARFLAEKTAGVRAAAAARFEDASRHLSLALGEWRGPVLDDLRGFQFGETFATVMAEEKLLAHAAKAESDIACGRAHAVIVELEGLTVDHPYREPLWAQLITAYYLNNRQADALGAYRRLQETLANDLGIDPSPALTTLHERILRQQPLDARKAASTTASFAVTALNRRTDSIGRTSMACLREPSGRVYALEGVATRIGRLGHNDIVLDRAEVSRQHAVIIDTGASYLIHDLRSANGVDVQRQRIRSATVLNDGDHVRIANYEFTFHVTPTSMPGVLHTSVGSTEVTERCPEQSL